MKNATQERPEDIIAYWFAVENRDLWFKATPARDAELKQRFENLWEAARDSRVEHWRDTPEGCLALAIVLDQFPLNMYRGQPASFVTQDHAIAVTRHALANAFDARLPLEQRAFLYMPLMHSENLDDQDESVRCFESAGLKDNLRFARHHRELIQRFGRFPHRNAILGRGNTAEEAAYLASEAAFRG